MKSLFDTTYINKLKLKNRFIRSATWENMASQDGHITPELLQLYKNLASGGVALIITGCTDIFEDEKPRRNMLSIYDDSFIKEYKKLTDMVHENHSGIVMQIAQRDGYAGPEGQVDTSEFSDKISKEHMEDIANAFANAAYRAKQCDFDGVEIHGADGCFLSKTVSTIYNTRTDDYGGSVENRAKFIFEVYNKIRSKVGKSFNVFIKINSSEVEEKKVAFDDWNYLCRLLDKAGINAIEISGNIKDFKDKGSSEALFKKYAQKVAEKVKCSVILVGLNRSVFNMNDILNNTPIEYFSMSRPFICEPDLINKWLSGSTTKSSCISCSRCMTDKGIRCIYHI